MPARHMRWLAVLAATGLAVGAARAQTPQPPQTFAVTEVAPQPPAGRPLPDPPRASGLPPAGADFVPPPGLAAPEAGPAPCGDRGLLFLPAPAEPRRSPLDVSWSDGLQFESPN